MGHGTAKFQVGVALVRAGSCVHQPWALHRDGAATSRAWGTYFLAVHLFCLQVPLQQVEPFWHGSPPTPKAVPQVVPV